MLQQDLERRAAGFFDRPGYANPVFLNERLIAVLDDRSGTPQVSLLHLPALDVEPCTSFAERVQSLHASATGVIAFGMDTGGNERQQIWRTDVDGQRVQLTNRPDAIHEPGAIAGDGSHLLIRTNARDEATFDIVRVDLADGAQRIVVESAGQAMPVAIRDDGAFLYVRTNSNLDADVVLVDEGRSTVLTGHTGEAWVLGATFHPVDDSVWILTNDGVEFVRLVRLDTDSGERETVFEDTWDVEAFSLSPDGKTVAIAVNENGWSRIGLLHLVGKVRSPRWLDLPRGTIDRFSWSPDGRMVAFGFSTATSPSAVVLAELSGSIKLVSGEGGSSLEVVPVEPELVHYDSFDGLSVPAFFFRPHGDGPFPVLVEIHGGPESQRRLQYTSAIPTDQLISSTGIAVLSLNVRGSTGYGKHYSHLDDRDLRLDAVRDVVAAVAWLRQRDDVIHDRIGVMGQSYGGFMTLACIAFYPELWCAAVDVVGIANFVTFLERTGPWRRRHRSEEYGFLETDRAMLERISPIHSVDQVTAPLHIIHGRNDPRVPLFEAEQMRDALAARQHPVSMRVFDDEGHGLSKRRNRVVGYAEATGFLVEHLRR